MTRYAWHNLNFMTETVRDYSGQRINVAHSNVDNDTRVPTVVFLHGVLRRWQSFYTLLPDLEHHFNLTAVDFRGHGRSDPASSYYQVIDYVADAVSVLNDIDGPVILYGHSLGAMVALAACSRTSADVRHTILEDPPFSTMGHRLPDLPLMCYFQEVENCVSAEQSQHDTNDDDLERVSHLFDSFSDMVVGENSDGSPIRVRDQRDEAARWFAAESFAQLDASVLQPITTGQWLHDYDLPSIASATNTPLTVLQADSSSGGMLTGDELQTLQKNCPATVNHVFCEKTGHGIHWEQPEQVVSIIRQL